MYEHGIRQYLSVLKSHDIIVILLKPKRCSISGHIPMVCLKSSNWTL